jgi:transposase-like protein
MAVTISGRQFWLWRAVDDEGEVFDLLVQRRRDKAAAPFWQSLTAPSSQKRRQKLAEARR